MDSLPIDIFNEIILLLPLWKINDVAVCNTHLNQLCQNNDLWRQLYIRDYKNIRSNSDSTKWFDKYYMVNEVCFNAENLWINSDYKYIDANELSYQREYCEALFDRLELMFDISDQKAHKWNIYVFNQERRSNYYEYINNGVLANNMLVASILLIMINSMARHEEYEFFQKAQYTKRHIYYDRCDGYKCESSLTDILRHTVDRYSERIEMINLGQTKYSEISKVKKVWTLLEVKEQFLKVLEVDQKSV